jgi:hypothetical protein
VSGERHVAYRLYARIRRCGAFGYWRRFAREDDPERIAERWRGFAGARLAEL